MALVAFVTANAEFRWGPQVGVNISTLNFKQELLTVGQSAGCDVGVVGELMFPGIGFGIDLGLNYSMHGAKVNLGEKKIWASEGYGNEQLYLHTLQIPINLKFKYTRLNGIERTIAPFVYGGPVFSFNLSHSDVKAFEFPGGSMLLQCGLGAELFRRFQISGGYYWGVTYEARTLKLENFSCRPQGWTVKLTWLF